MNSNGTYNSSPSSISSTGAVITGITGAQPTQSTSWSPFVFVFLTCVFGYFKYTSNLKMYPDKVSGEGIPTLARFTNSILYFLIYFVIIFVCQMSESVSALNKICTDNASNNFLSAFSYCFGPWFFIFLGMVAILVFFPTVKKAFSDVIGYAFVAKSLNIIFSKLLFSGTEVKNKLSDPKLNSAKKDELELAAEAIMKIVEKNSVFVNQMEPQDFAKKWDVLTPLMKITDQSELDEIKTKMFTLVLWRDIVGEICWYIYTGVFVCTIVSFNVSSMSCKKSVAQLQKEFSTTVPVSDGGGPNTQNIQYD